METKIKLIVKSVYTDNNDLLVVDFQLPLSEEKDFKYYKGQYITLCATIEDKEIRRAYSICAAEQENLIRIAIKRIENGLFSNWAHKHLQKSFCIDALLPQGDFGSSNDNVNNSQNKQRYVLFAVGTGITPILSILKTLLLSSDTDTIILIYGNRYQHTMAFKNELYALKNQHMQRLVIIPIFSRENSQGLNVLNGRINYQKCWELQRLLQPVNEIGHVFICGPINMSAELAQFFIDNGLSQHKMSYETFQEERPALGHKSNYEDGKSFELTIIYDGVTHQVFDNGNLDTILNIGLSNNINVPYSCKNGVCGSCKCKVIQGKTLSRSHYALSEQEILHNVVLSCQTTLLDKKVIVDFDM